jgi:hypothetical protein
VQTGLLSHVRNMSWDDNPDLFGLKVVWGIARAFVMWAADTVSLPDFLNGGTDSNEDSGSLFCHFGQLFDVKSFNEFVCVFGQGLYP